MKLRAVTLALVLLVAGIGASYAVAKGKPGSGTTSTGTTSTGTTTTTVHGKGKGKLAACKPNVSFILNGTFVSAGASSFTMNVTHTNRHAKGLGKPATINVGATTKITRNGKSSTLSDLQAGDRLNVQARGCKNPPAGTVQTMVAKRVVAHPASGSVGTTTGETTTSETTTSG